MIIDHSNIVHFDRDAQLIDRLDRLIANPPEGNVALLEYTPAVCQHVLRKYGGVHNRREKKAAINRYRAAIGKEEWTLNGSTVVFTDQHLLGDGQHRMMAGAGATRSFWSYTVFGIDHGCFYSIDQGRVRNPGDVLHIAGVPNSGVMKNVIRWAVVIETGRAKNRITLTPPETLDHYNNGYKETEDFLPEARRIARSNGQPVALVAALLFLFNKADPILAADFSEAWATNSYGDRFLPIAKMQEAIGRLKAIANGRVHDVVRAAMIVKAWNACRAGKRGRDITWHTTMPFPLIQ